MAHQFTHIFESLKQASIGLHKAADGIQQATEGIILATEGLLQTGNSLESAADAAMASYEEQEDLRETINRLEGLVLEQGAEIRAIRAQLNGKNNHES